MLFAQVDIAAPIAGLEGGWSSALLAYGPLGVFTTFMLLVIWKLVNLCVDEVPKIRQGHVDFLDATKKQGDSLAESIKAISLSMTAKGDERGDPKYKDHLFSTYRTNLALAVLSDLIKDAAKAGGSEIFDIVAPHCDAIKEALNNRDV